jgi:hypothetical protein
MRRNRFLPAVIAVAVGTVAAAVLIGAGLASLPLATALVFPLVLVVAADGVHDQDAAPRAPATGDHSHDRPPVAAGSSNH